MNGCKDAARCWRNEIDRKKGWWSVVRRKRKHKGCYIFGRHATVERVKREVMEAL
jgi:hypothetical protein